MFHLCAHYFSITHTIWLPLWSLQTLLNSSNSYSCKFALLICKRSMNLVPFRKVTITGGAKTFIQCNVYFVRILKQVGKYSGVMVLNATFNNISVISWRSVLLMEETGVPGENHRPVASHWQTLSHTVVSSTPRHEQGSNSQVEHTYMSYDIFWFLKITLCG